MRSAPQTRLDRWEHLRQHGRRDQHHRHLLGALSSDASPGTDFAELVPEAVKVLAEMLKGEDQCLAFEAVKLVFL